MSEVVPGSVPGRPWLDRRGSETFVEYVERIKRTCTTCGDESDAGESHPPHACIAPDINEIITGLGLNVWPFD